MARKSANAPCAPLPPPPPVANHSREHLRCRTFVEDPDPKAQLSIGSLTLIKLKLCFSVFKNMVLGRPRPEAQSRGEGGGAGAEAEEGTNTKGSDAEVRDKVDTFCINNLKIGCYTQENSTIPGICRAMRGACVQVESRRHSRLGLPWVDDRQRVSRWRKPTFRRGLVYRATDVSGEELKMQKG